MRVDEKVRVGVVKELVERVLSEGWEVFGVRKKGWVDERGWMWFGVWGSGRGREVLVGLENGVLRRKWRVWGDVGSEVRKGEGVRVVIRVGEESEFVDDRVKFGVR